MVKTSARDYTDLVLPTSRAGVGTSALALARLLTRYPNRPAVRLDTRDLSGADIAALHTRGQCFVSLCRSEGWGLGAFDAATHANPVVITGFGGHLDYLDPSTASLVDFERVPARDPSGWTTLAPGQVWAQPSLQDGAAKMRGVFQDFDLHAKRAAALAERLAHHYRPAAIADLFMRAVSSVEGVSRQSEWQSETHSAPLDSR